MKRLLAILLISLYVTNFTEVHQLLKLPLLVEHYFEHKRVASALTFIEFLSLHYNTQTPHDDHDMELPFKDCGHCIANPTVVLTGFKIALKELVPIVNSITYFSYCKKFIPASYLSEIWQPPRY